MSGASAPVTAAALHALAREGALSPRAYARARELAGIAPDSARWSAFLERSLGIAGAALLAAAFALFVADRWAAMGALEKLAGIEALLAFAGIVALLRGPRSAAGRAALFAAALLTGALLAANPRSASDAQAWPLFAAWTALAIPWALAAAWPPLWALALGLANAALMTWIGAGAAPAGLETAAPVAVTALNAFAAALAEAFGPREGSLHRLVPRLAVGAALVAATAGVLRFLFFAPEEGLPLVAGYALGLPLAIAAYRLLRLDLIVLSLAAFSAIVVAASAVANAALDRLGETALLLIALTVIAMSAGAAQWIRRLARGQRA